MQLYQRIRSFLRMQVRRRGYTVNPFPLARYLQDFSIDCVLDVGANVGQYATELRGLGYRKRIESFEPMGDAWELLCKRASGDPNWNVHRMAIGDESADRTLNVSANGPSSSLLPLTAAGKNTTGVNLNYVSQETVTVRRLDDIWPSLNLTGQRIFLKIDTQGYERNVLQGVSSRLADIAGVQIEVPLSSIYESEWLAADFLQWFDQQGFSPYWIMPGFRDRQSNQLLDFDIIFFRSNQIG